ncbi:MAG: choice-of-anchor B family protein, partial [Pseudomonadota bacterium]
MYDVTDAENPREVGFIDGQLTTWRDIKVHQFWNATEERWNAYAYISADSSTDGLFIIDLTELPQRISRLTYNSDFDAAHNVYLMDAEFSTGLSITGDAPVLILAGSNQSDGRFRSYTLSNPASPSFVAAPSTPAGQPGGDRLYMHDGASMVVTDSRKDTQCVNGTDHCDIVFDFNEGSLDIWDVTSTANPVRLSRTPYSNSAYTHSGWWSEDQQTVYVQDELDERDRFLNTTLRAFNISDLTAPQEQTGWTGPTTAIDHNGFVRGNRYYMSNYSRGLTILDITNQNAPTLVGRFDTFPSGDAVGFPGAWGTYPYLPSGNIAISDIDSGLYMVRDRTLDVAEGTLAFAAASAGADESQSLEIDVTRSGGSQGAISVAWELIGATADSTDVSNSSGTLSWNDGDAASKTITLNLVSDGNAEGLERALLRLHAPTGGATLSSPSMASAWISDPGTASTIEFLDTRVSTTERDFATAVAVVRRTGSSLGAVSVDYAVTGGTANASNDYSGPATGTLNWADGDATPRNIEYAVTDDTDAEPDEFFEISLSNPGGANLGTNTLLQVDIIDGTGSNSAPNAVAGSAQTVAGGSAVTL